MGFINPKMNHWSLLINSSASSNYFNYRYFFQDGVTGFVKNRWRLLLKKKQKQKQKQGKKKHQKKKQNRTKQNLTKVYVVWVIQ